jgi:hypothetical protein
MSSADGLHGRGAAGSTMENGGTTPKKNVEMDGKSRTETRKEHKIKESLLKKRFNKHHEATIKRLQLRTSQMKELVKKWDANRKSGRYRPECRVTRNIVKHISNNLVKLKKYEKKNTYIEIVVFGLENDDISNIYSSIAKKVPIDKIIKIRRVRYKSKKYVRIVCCIAEIEKLRLWCKKRKLKVSSNITGKKRRKETGRNGRTKLKLASLNINKITNKVIELNILLNNEKPDIMCVQETWKADNFRLRFPRYECLEYNSGSNKNRGLVTLVRRDSGVRSYIARKGVYSLLCCVEFYKGEGTWNKLLIINTYIPNDNPGRTEALKEIIKLIRMMKEKNSYDEIISMGDFNMIPRVLQNKLATNGIYVAMNFNRIRGTRVDGAGKVTGRRIDYIMRIVKGDTYRMRISTKWFISDHLVVFRRLDIPKRRILSRETIVRHEIKTKTERICETLSAIECPSYYEIVHIIISVLRKHNVMKTMKNEKVKYYSSKLLRRFKKFNKWKKEQCLGSSPRDSNRIEEIEKKLKKTKEAERRKITEKWALKGIEYLAGNRPRELWKWLKGNKNSNQDRPLKNASGVVVSDRIEKLEITRKHYEGLAEYRYEGNPYEPLAEAENEEIGVSYEELREANKNCANNKACGPDGIPSEVWKMLIKEEQDDAPSLIGVLQREMDEVMKGKDIPAEWCNGEIVSLFKKGDENDINNYRGIAIINTSAKIFLKIINSKLTDFLEEKNSISKFQCGFRRNEEGVSHVATLLEIVKRRELKKLNTFMCFFDFEKAYDNVVHDLLFKKMEKMNINKAIINVIKQLYKNTKMRIRMGDMKSSEYAYKKGVRQGCPCSPTLFNIFVNDVFDQMEGIIVPGLDYTVPGLLFADDIVIFAESKDQLENKIERLMRWATENVMKVNTPKCGILNWNRRNDEEVQIPVETRFGTINEVREYTYLGINIRNNLLEEDIVKNSVRKGKIALEKLKGRLMNKNISIVLKTMLVRNILIPIIMYGRELWGMSSVRAGKIRNVVRRAFIMMSGIRNVSIDRISEDLNIMNIQANASLGRMRAISKWRSSKLVIKNIIEAKFVARKTVWSTRSRRWIKRFLGENVWSTDRQNMRSIIVELYRTRISRNRTKAIDFANKYMLESSPLRKLVGEISVTESLIFTKVRCNGITYTEGLIRRGIVGAAFMNKCAMCGADGMEDTEHFLLDCETFSSVRIKYYDLLADVSAKYDNDRTRKVSVLLCGRYYYEAYDNLGIAIRSIKYIYELVRLRNIRLSRIRNQE